MPSLLLLALSASALSLPAQTTADVFLVPDVPQPGDELANGLRGHSIAAWGDQALVGAADRSVQGIRTGAAFLFQRQPGGPTGDQWDQIAELTAPAGLDRDRVGASVALGPGVAIVGAPGPFSNSQTSGAVHVFSEGAGWGHVQRLTVPGLPNDASFGASVALDGDRLVVGAPGSGFTPGEGRAYLFERVGGTWALVETFSGAPSLNGDSFGYAVAIDGDRVAVGAPLGAGSGANSRDGGAFVFERQPSGDWTQAVHVQAVAPQRSFGDAVDIEGDVLAVGAPFASGFGPYQGSVSLYRAGANGWSLDAELRPTLGNDRFGDAVALDLPSLWVGAPSALWGGGVRHAVHSFTETAGVWQPVSRRTQHEAGVGYGRSLALDGGRAFIAHPGASEPGVQVVADRPFDVELFCFCPSAGCTNVDPEAGCGNITGSGCLLTASGTTSIADNALSLTASNTGPFAFGLVFMGRTQTAPMFFGNGMRCIDDPVGLQRFPVRSGGAAGVATEGTGLIQYSQAAHGVAAQIMAGSTWSFQFWYRDPGACMTGFNVSNAVAVTFTP